MVTQTSDRSDIPAHVPPDLIRPIGLVEGPEFLAAPYAFMASLHETHPPVFFSTSTYGPAAWMLIKHEDCFHVLRHPEVFTSTTSTPFPRDPDNYFPMIPLEIDPPDHRKYRAILDPLFSPQAITRLEGAIRKLANDLIDEFIDEAGCEFTTAFGRPLPVSVFLDLMGLPQDMRDTFVRWAMGLLHSQNREVNEKSMRETCAYLQQVIDEKTRRPDSAVISTVVHGRAAGEALSGPEIFGFVFFLFIAGLDTVFATLNNIFVWLANNAERRREIIANPNNINNVIEELLRVFSVTFGPLAHAGLRVARRQAEEGRQGYQRSSRRELRSGRVRQSKAGRLSSPAQTDPRLRGRRAQLHGRTSGAPGSQDFDRGVPASNS